eukprot:s2617_g1.t2
MKSTLVLLAVLLATGASITTRTDAANGGNPIRKVITMMEKMSEKIESEAEKESDLYEKFDCYCKNTVKELEENIMQAESNPISPADIEKKESEIVALQQEVTKLKDDRIAEEESLKAATAQRGKAAMGCSYGFTSLFTAQRVQEPVASVAMPRAASEKDVAGVRKVAEGINLFESKEEIDELIETPLKQVEAL